MLDYLSSTETWLLQHIFVLVRKFFKGDSLFFGTHDPILFVTRYTGQLIMRKIAKKFNLTVLSIIITVLLIHMTTGTVTLTTG